MVAVSYFSYPKEYELSQILTPKLNNKTKIRIRNSRGTCTVIRHNHEEITVQLTQLLSLSPSPSLSPLSIHLSHPSSSLSPLSFSLPSIPLSLCFCVQVKGVSQNINYTTIALLPVLTTLFDHIAQHQFGDDVICESDSLINYIITLS